MNRTVRFASFFLATFLLPGCALLRFDPMHPLIRSDVIKSEAEEKEILAKAKLTWTDDGRIRVLYVSGTPYERGYQQGKLLRSEIQDNLGYLYRKAVGVFHSEELFAEVYERMRPYMSQDYIDEMRGLAHGSRMPLTQIHYIHVLADMGEWGGKKKLKSVVKSMLSGELATMCSNIAASGSATADRRLYALRILDWGLHKVSRLHQYPLITINIPERGIPSANIGWVGYLGAVSGMNTQGITLGEMGYKDPDNETLDGQPMPFLLRDVMNYANNLSDVRRLIEHSKGTNSYVFVMTDGKNGEAEMYVKDRDRFLVFKPGKDVSDGKEAIRGVPDIAYGGKYNDKLFESLSAAHGNVSPESLMSIVPKVAMKSNFQNVVYDPASLRFWVNNAYSPRVWAVDQPYTHFDFGKGLREYQSERH